MTQQVNDTAQLSEELIRQALQESEHRYRAMFENMRSGVAVYQAVDDGKDFVFQDFNRSAELISRVQKTDLVGKRLLDVFPNMGKFGLLASLQRAYRTGLPEHIPASYYKDELREGWRENFIYKLPSGEIVAIYDDITEQKCAEEALKRSKDELELQVSQRTAELRESRDRFQNLTENTQDLIWEVDHRGVYTYVSPTVADILGYTAEQVIGRVPWEFMEQEEANRVSRIFEAIVASQDPISGLENTNLHRAGNRVVLETNGLPFFSSDGTLRGFRGIDRDITKRKQVEETLRVRTYELGERVKELNCLYGISRLVDKAGISLDEILQGVVDLIPPSLQYPEIACARLLLKDRTYSSSQYMAPFSQQSATIILHGNIIGSIEIGYFDETPQSDKCPFLKEEVNLLNAIAEQMGQMVERRQALELLRESRENFRAFFETIDDIIVVGDSSGKIIYANPTVSRKLGYTPDELRTMNLLDLNPENRRQEAEKIFASMLRGETEICPLPLERKDGTLVDVETRAWVGRWSETDCLFGVCKDVSDRKRMEQERLEMTQKLLEAQKLESLGVMAAGIAHDFNNQLAIVLGNLELTLMDPNVSASARPHIKNALEAARRSSELSLQMQMYAGDMSGPTADIDLRELLKFNLSLLKMSVSNNVNLRLEIYRTLAPVRGDADQILRLILNILVNASEAIGDQKGEAHLSTGVMNCDEACLSLSRLEEKPSPGTFVYIDVTDTGCGMNDEIQRKLFEPFFTTKFLGRGLGMAEVIGIVRSHHGAIMVFSLFGEGTTVRVLFPASGEALAPPLQ